LGNSSTSVDNTFTTSGVGSGGVGAGPFGEKKEEKAEDKYITIPVHLPIEKT